MENPFPRKSKSLFENFSGEYETLERHDADHPYGGNHYRLRHRIRKPVRSGDGIDHRFERNVFRLRAVRRLEGIRGFEIGENNFRSRLFPKRVNGLYRLGKRRLRG